MLIDTNAELETTVAFDLGVKSPGAGKPICMRAEGVAGTLTITTGDTSAAADFLTAVDANNPVSFTLPSVAKQFIKATFTGEVYVVMDSQTNS